jgi:hypothetical protein
MISGYRTDVLRLFGHIAQLDRFIRRHVISPCVAVLELRFAIRVSDST